MNEYVGLDVSLEVTHFCWFRGHVTGPELVQRSAGGRGLGPGLRGRSVRPSRPSSSVMNVSAPSGRLVRVCRRRARIEFRSSHVSPELPPSRNPFDRFCGRRN